MSPPPLTNDLWPIDGFLGRQNQFSLGVQFPSWLYTLQCLAHKLELMGCRKNIKDKHDTTLGV